jgi:hypothetical protein
MGWRRNVSWSFAFHGAGVEVGLVGGMMMLAHIAINEKT